MDAKTKKAILSELNRAYWMEMETVVNYSAHAANLDGVQAEHLRENLAADAKAELEHAAKLADRIHILGGLVSGSRRFKAWQDSLQPRRDTTDLKPVIEGVVDAETSAIVQYRKIVNLSKDGDPATADLATRILADEQAHRRKFLGYLVALENKKAQPLSAPVS